jgi:guanine deaminase
MGLPRFSISSMASSPDTSFLHDALDLAVENVESGLGGPFAAIVVENGSVLATGTNRVTTTQDPTAHAEITAIRAACRERGDFELDGCTLYSTCEPCPMCLGAIYWTRLDRVVYAATRSDAAEAGFDDDHIYQEIDKAPADRRIPMEQRLKEAAERPFEAWRDYDERIEY